MGDWFQAEYVAIMDKVAPLEIETNQAIEFFNTNFGLDFSQSGPDEVGQCFFENAMFRPFHTDPNLGYTITFHRWIISGTTRSTCFPNHDGGFLATFNPEQLLRGTYIRRS